MAGPPTVHLSFHNPASTPKGSLYPLSNYAEYDPALPTFISVEYSSYVTDSISIWGTYDPDGGHEIFQDPDKRLIFPFSLAQSFTDHYAKTNYSDATTISSYQTGDRTVTFSGYGTLILPQGPFANVAMVTEVRTNSLGPDSYVYTWYDISNGKKLLYRSENDGSITTAWCADATVTGIHETGVKFTSVVYPHPLTDVSTLNIDPAVNLDQAVLRLYNAQGEELRSVNVYSHTVSIHREGLPSGLYFYQLYSKGNPQLTGRLMVR